MPEYREFAPPPRLLDAVECFWSMRCDQAGAILHRVLPDGCADILFTLDGSSAALDVIGPMTRFEDYRQPAGRVLLGVRFRPGMWTALIGAPAHLLTDRVLPLDDLWGARARGLRERLGDVADAHTRATLLSEFLPELPRRTPIERALAFMEQRHGRVSLDETARAADIGVRQFRRLCQSHVGLSPKLLGRVLRFRHALSRLDAEADDHAGLAADCGYADQSHFIAEFRRFSGRTPAATGNNRSS